MGATVVGAGWGVKNRELSTTRHILAFWIFADLSLTREGERLLYRSLCKKLPGSRDGCYGCTACSFFSFRYLFTRLFSAVPPPPSPGQVLWSLCATVLP